MADIIVYDRDGKKVEKTGIETLELDTTTEGKTTIFTHGIAMDNVPIAVDFSSGNMTIDGGGYLVRSAIIQKPAGLIPENVADGINIAGIVGTHKGGSGAVTHTVTFKNGSTTIYEKQVTHGDTCGDIVALGVIDTPTKTPTNTIAYVHTGWSLTDGGGADSNALVNVTENRTVYAAYEETVRLYTVRFFDGDTLIHTMQVEYMQDADYIPTKEGYFLESWQPSNKGITADVDCYAQWSEKPNFATASWAKIKEIAEAEQAKTFFKEGDTKNITLKNGEVISVCIAGFSESICGNPETNSMVLKPTKITFMTENSPSIGMTWNDTNPAQVPTNIIDLLPDDLVESMSYAYKPYDKADRTGTQAWVTKFWLPTIAMLNKPYTEATGVNNAAIQNGNLLYPFKNYGTATTDRQKWKRYDTAGNAVSYYTASRWIPNTSFRYFYVNSSGKLDMSNDAAANRGCLFCFTI